MSFSLNDKEFAFLFKYCCSENCDKLTFLFFSVILE